MSSAWLAGTTHRDVELGYQGLRVGGLSSQEGGRNRRTYPRGKRPTAALLHRATSTLLPARSGTRQRHLECSRSPAQPEAEMDGEREIGESFLMRKRPVSGKFSEMGREER